MRRRCRTRCSTTGSVDASRPGRFHGSCTRSTRPSTGGWCFPRGLVGLLSTVVRGAGSTLEIDDQRAEGTPQQFVLTATLRGDQADAVADHDHGVLVAPPGSGKT